MGWFSSEPKLETLQAIAESRLMQLKGLSTMLSTQDSQGKFTPGSIEKIESMIAYLNEGAKDNASSERRLYIVTAKELEKSWKNKDIPSMRVQIGILFRIDNKILGRRSQDAA